MEEREARRRRDGYIWALNQSTIQGTSESSGRDFEGVEDDDDYLSPDTRPRFHELCQLYVVAQHGPLSHCLNSETTRSFQPATSWSSIVLNTQPPPSSLSANRFCFNFLYISLLSYLRSTSIHRFHTCFTYYHLLHQFNHHFSTQ